MPKFGKLAAPKRLIAIALRTHNFIVRFAQILDINKRFDRPSASAREDRILSSEPLPAGALVNFAACLPAKTA